MEHWLNVAASEFTYIRSATGIEALAWLTDVGGLPRADAVELMRWSARAMLDAATAARR